LLLCGAPIQVRLTKVSGAKNTQAHQEAESRGSTHRRRCAARGCEMQNNACVRSIAGFW